MKKLIYIILLILTVACDSDSANDCFQTSGTIVQQDVTVPDFEKILVNRNVQLILTESANYSVLIETGQNLINDVSAVVVDNKLQLTDSNTCNYVRDFNATKIYVSAPNITEIRNASQFEILSNGVLNYPSLKLISEDFNNSDFFAVGDFRLQVNTNQLSITSNNISFFYLSGETENLNVFFPSGDGRFEGRNLIAQNITVSHRGTNDMVVNPQQSITGVLRSTGNVISVNEPPTVSVEQLYTGSLIFE